MSIDEIFTRSGQLIWQSLGCQLDVAQTHEERMAAIRSVQENLVQMHFDRTR